MPDKFEKITIIGPGLIGSSLGLALKKNNMVKRIVGIDNSSSNLDNALKNGSIDLASNQIGETISNSSIIFICTPVSQINKIIHKVIPFTNKETIISDVGSVKNIFLKTTLNFIKKNCQFVPGHPIAGTEFSGAKNADSELFKNKWCILTPKNKKDSNVKIIGNLWERLGMKISIMTAEEHDKIMSVTSHLPHLIAFTIVGTAFNMSIKKKKDLLNFSAGGFRDFTRIGSSDPKMWSDIFLKNKKYLLKTLESFNDDLNKLRNLIVKTDEQEIIKLLKKTKKIRREILQVEKKF